VNKQKLANIPSKPGVYLFKDKRGVIIYIGKAGNLKSRVHSYFQKSANLEPAKEVMVTKIAALEYIIVDSEVEALLLETSLIKKHKPPYNVNLKDDKYFVYLKITLEDEFPKVLTVRRVSQDKNKYFGPFTSALAVKDTLRLVRRVFPYKTCKNPPEKPCLGYHIGRCLGHVTKDFTKQDYQKIIEGVIKFLEGKNKSLLLDLKRQMQAASRQKKYEQAARIRDQIRSMEHLMGKQKVVSTKRDNQDVISLARNSNQAAINLFQIREGKLQHREQFLLQNIELRSDSELIESFLNQYYAQASFYPKEIIVPTKIANQKSLEKLTKAKFVFPQKGKKQQLIKMGQKNAEEYLRQTKLEAELRDQSGQKALAELAGELGINKTLHRIEAYDISNIQGTNAVGSLVVFTAGRPDKAQYRKFRIKTVKGANDPAMMAEVISRRFHRIEDKEKNSPRFDRVEAGQWPLPDLIILDGGKGQLSSVIKVLNILSIAKPVIALAKREEEIFRPNQKNPVRLSNNSPSLRLLQQIRDEAHRFAIGYYRKRHQAETKKSVLDEILGIGPKTKKKLLFAFGSVQKIKEASWKDLEKVVGGKMTRKIKEYL